MPPSTFETALAQAAIDAIRERAYGHPAVHPMPFARLLSELLPPLAVEHKRIVTKQALDGACDKAASEARLGDDGGAEGLKDLLKAYRLVHEDGEAGAYRIRNRADVPPPWLSFEDVAAPHLPQRERFRRLAHLHMLAFPELLEVVELLAPPGRTKTGVENSLCDRFVFTRKINKVVAAYLISVMREFDMAASHDQVLYNSWAPPTVLGSLVLRRYLELTEFTIDRGVDTADILRQCASIVPGPFFQRHPAEMQWYRSLEAPADACISEVGGAQLRIRPEGIIWFARAGMLAPLQCAAILRQRGARESFANLKRAILTRVHDSKLRSLPINAGEIEAELGTRGNA